MIAFGMAIIIVAAIGTLGAWIANARNEIYAGLLASALLGFLVMELGALIA